MEAKAVSGAKEWAKRDLNNQKGCEQRSQESIEVFSCWVSDKGVVIHIGGDIGTYQDQLKMTLMLTDNFVNMVGRMWNDSFKKVSGLDRPTVAGLDV